MVEEDLPLVQRCDIRARARLFVQPGVVQLPVEQRALEAFDDLELRIEAGLDRIHPQQRLAEGVNRLRAQRVDPRELLGTGAAERLAAVGRHFEQRTRRAARPDDALVVETSVQLDERVVDAIGDLARRFFGEGDEDDPLRRELFVPGRGSRDSGSNRNIDCWAPFTMALMPRRPAASADRPRA